MKKAMTALAALCLVLVVSSGAYAAKGLLTGHFCTDFITLGTDLDKMDESKIESSPSAAADAAAAEAAPKAAKMPVSRCSGARESETCESSVWTRAMVTFGL